MKTDLVVHSRSERTYGRMYMMLWWIENERSGRILMSNSLPVRSSLDKRIHPGRSRAV
jgi:hypothetical protein